MNPLESIFASFNGLLNGGTSSTNNVANVTGSILNNMPSTDRSMLASNGYDASRINTPVGGGILGGLKGVDGDWSGIRNLGTGLNALTSVWSALQGNKIAKQQMAFQKDAYNTNLADGRQTYNTALEDKLRSRTAVGHADESAISDYMKKHGL